MAVPNVSSKPSEEARKQPTAKEECFDMLKSIGVVALGAIICGIAIALFPISIPIIIGWNVHNQNVAEKVRTAVQQALPKTEAPIQAIDSFKETVNSLKDQSTDTKKIFVRCLAIPLKDISPENITWSSEPEHLKNATRLLFNLYASIKILKPNDIANLTTEIKKLAEFIQTEINNLEPNEQKSVRTMIQIQIGIILGREFEIG
jgi:hypothetical protein